VAAVTSLIGALAIAAFTRCAFDVYLIKQVYMSDFSALPYSTMFIVFRTSWARIFNDDPGTIKHASPRLRV